MIAYTIRLLLLAIRGLCWWLSSSIVHEQTRIDRYSGGCRKGSASITCSYYLALSSQAACAAFVVHIQGSCRTRSEKIFRTSVQSLGPKSLEYRADASTALAVSGRFVWDDHRRHPTAALADWAPPSSPFLVGPGPTILGTGDFRSGSHFKWRHRTFKKCILRHFWST